MLYCSRDDDTSMGAAHIEPESEITAFVLAPRAQHLRPVLDAPRLSESGGQLLREVEVLDETGERRKLHVPIERPMTIVIDGRELVTLMTLGARPELLTLGYLRNQRVIAEVREVESITVEWSSNLSTVVRRGTVTQAGRTQAGAPTACSLGTEFGEVMRRVDMATGSGRGGGGANAGGLRPSVGARVSRTQLLRILEVTREYDAIHRAAGSVHGCALFEGGDLLVTLEDVSRHNGLDTVVGWMMLHGVAGVNKLVFTTGRLTGEMVMKAAHNGYRSWCHATV